MNEERDKSIDGVDNLIPDDLEAPKNKVHTILTIIALFIIVLMSTIIMTKMILDDSKEEDSSLKDPNSVKDPALILDSSKKDRNRSSISHNIKPDTVSTYDLASYDDGDTISNSSDASSIMDIESSNKVKVEDKKPIIKEKKVPIIKEEIVEKPKVIKKEPIIKGSYYIQVGSFTEAPSKRLISVIKSSGFAYTLRDSGKYKKLLIGGYRDRDMASRALIKVKDKINKSAFIIKLK